MKTVWWVLLFVLFVLIINFFVFFFPSIKEGMLEKKLLNEGIEASAEIINVVDTGNRYNSNLGVVILLKVKPAEEEPFLAEIKTVLSAVEISQLTQGSMVQVLYSLSDKTQVMLKK
ncbi:MAG: hypothetical protein NUV97_02850 [archaeon]|nr:hypothetical protein [archaeon]MCR4323935.1 hypothetical protein [Nanoarchaeota archaeon]